MLSSHCVPILLWAESGYIVGAPNASAADCDIVVDRVGWGGRIRTCECRI